MESLENCPEVIPQNIGKGGRAAVPLEKQLLLTLELSRKSNSFQVEIVQIVYFRKFCYHSVIISQKISV